MENKPFVSIEEVDDVSSKDEYQVALQNGLTEAEAEEQIINGFLR